MIIEPFPAFSNWTETHPFSIAFSSYQPDLKQFQT